jgi:hypothetical protein
VSERKLVKKVLTLEVFEWNRETKKRGPVLAVLKGWDEVDRFFEGRGTKLIRETTKDGITMIRMPEGWDSMVVAMENHYDDGTVEAM